MPGFWVRVDATVESHPKAIRAGWWGVRAAEALWKVCKLYGVRGVLKADFCTAEYLAGFTHGGAEQLTGYRIGIEAAVREHFVDPLEDGSFRVHNWKEKQWDETAAERQRRHRDKVSDRDVTRDATPVTAVTPLPSPPAPPLLSPDPTPTPTSTSCAPIGAPPLSSVEEVADRRAVGQRLQADYVSEVAVLIEECYLREHGMASDAGNGIKREVAGHLINIAKRDGFGESRRANKAEVVRIAEAYFRDQDPFVAEAKHPWKMLLSERVTRYRRPLAKQPQPQPEAKANG